MTVLPIVDRELRVASRKRGTYFSRAGAALIAIGVTLWAMTIMRHRPPQSLGQMLFAALSTVIFIYAFTAGIRVTSDSLSEEKREGTLGLLFLTDLRGVDIIFGKLVATSVRVVYGMLAVFPVLAVCLLLGGVTYGEFWRVFLVALAILFFSLTAGLLGSAICVDERRAFSLALLVAIGCVFACPILEWYRSDRAQVGFNMMFWIPSPVYGCFLVEDGEYRQHPEWFAMNVIFTAIYGLIFFGAACRIVPRSWQIRAEGPKSGRWRTMLSDLGRGSAETRRRLRRELLEVNPVCWLAARERGKIIAAWVFLIVCAAVWLWGFWRFKNDWLDTVNYATTMFLIHWMFKIWFAAEACRRFAEDRQSGALELLLSTPLTIPQILRGQWLALLRQFGGALFALLVVDSCFLVMGIASSRLSSEQSRFWALLWAVFVGTFVADLVALGWTGMWLGLTIQRVNRATSGACARILSLPWIAFGALITVFGAFSLFVSNWLTEYTVVIFGFGISVANSVFFSLSSRRRLLRDFRTIATMRGTLGRSIRWFGLPSSSSSVAPRKLEGAGASPGP